MGLVYADITLINSTDADLSERGDIPSDKVRQIEVKAPVDSGAISLVISDAIANQPMKTIAGAILILAATLYGITGMWLCYLFEPNGRDFSIFFPWICGFLWFLHLAIGVGLIIPETLIKRLQTLIKRLPKIGKILRDGVSGKA